MAFSSSVLFLSVAASCCDSNGLVDSGTTAKLVSIIVLKQLSNGTLMTIPSLNLRSILTDKSDWFCTMIVRR